MPRISRCIVILTLVCTCLTCGCGSGTNSSYPVVVFSDVHFSPFYDATIFPSLNSSDANEWNGIFQTSTISTPSTYGADCNYPLLVLALSSIQQNLGTAPLVIFTGDLLGHNFAQNYYTQSGSQDVAAMQAFADKTVAFFTAFVKSYVGNIPVMFVLGNADSYTSQGADSTFLSNTAETFYTNWIGSTADHQTFLDTYKAGGYYSAEPLGRNMLVVALNTFPLSTQATGNNDSAVQAELAWLDSTLASAKLAGKKVWLLMHTPPGAYTSQTASLLDGQGHLSSAVMMLTPAYQTSFFQTLSKYSSTIALMLGAHTHMDEFRNIYGDSPLSSQGFLEITPSITPVFDNNPAYKIFTFSNGGLAPTDYRSIYYNLTTLPAQLDPYYTFSAAYFGNAISGLLDDALTTLFPTLNTDTTRQNLFRTYYYSGSSTSSTITDTNWKVYWCAIANMAEQDLINCVNSL